MPERKRPAGPGRGHKIKQGNGEGGPGWGGPAKGAGKPMRTVEDANALKAALPEETKEEKAERKSALREEMLAFYVAVNRDNSETTLNRMAAADRILDRIEGKPVAKNINENTGPDGGPMATEIVYRWADPKE